jgi:hypothetical protein
MGDSNTPSWLTEAVRTVRAALESNARAARLAALLLALILAVGAVTWGYQVLTTRPNPQVQVNITVPKR